MSLHGCFSTGPLVFMPKRPVADDQNAKKELHLQENHTVCWNALVFFSARVLSHCGFILSLLAIWLAWLVPPAILAQPPAPDIKALKSRTSKPSRRPIPPLPSDVQTNLTPIFLPKNATSSDKKRKVYFADAPLEATTGIRPTVTESPAQAPQTSIPSLPAARLSVMLSSENAGSPAESLDSLVLESDSSSRPSSLKRPGLTNFKLFHSYSLDVNPTNEEIVSPIGAATLFLKGQRASLPSSKPPSRFPFRRCSAPVEQDPLGPKPIPRTMPYGPPYFATPPMLVDRHATARPRFKDEILNSQAPDSDIEHPRGRTIRRVDLNPNAVKYHKPRSLSENLVIL